MLQDSDFVYTERICPVLQTSFCRALSYAYSFMGASGMDITIVRKLTYRRPARSFGAKRYLRTKSGIAKYEDLSKKEAGTLRSFGNVRRKQMQNLLKCLKQSNQIDIVDI